jgi:hypothetical protein
MQIILGTRKGSRETTPRSPTLRAAERAGAALPMSDIIRPETITYRTPAKTICPAPSADARSFGQPAATTLSVFDNG